jgi:RecA-family ATPase
MNFSASHAMSALDVATSYIQRGWNPVPVPFRQKFPVDDGWQKRVINLSNVEQHFNSEPQNIGVVLGRSSGGLTDVDLDCPEAIAIAPLILPKTSAIFGRPSARFAHWLYKSNLSGPDKNAGAEEESKAVLSFKDSTLFRARTEKKATIVELRIGGYKGAQTVFPGSTHESGEAIRWEESGEPAAVDGAELLKKVKLVAVGALFIRYWPGLGARHDAALAVGGFMARAGYKPEWIKYFVERIARAAGCNDVSDKMKAAFDSATNTIAGKKTFGLTTIKELFGEHIAAKAAEWLDYEETADEPQSENTFETESPPQPSSWVDFGSWDDEPPPEQEWAVRDRFPLRQTSIFSGDGGLGKSTVQLQQAVAHALGKDWFGTLPELGPALFVDAEDDDSVLRRRLGSILTHYGATFADAKKGGLHLMSLVGKDAVLAGPGRGGKLVPTPLYKQFLEAARDIKPKLIAIASSADVFAGNELDRSQVKQFISLLTRIAIAANGSVNLISHPSLTGINSGSGLSGSTQWHNSVRARAFMSAVKSDDGQPEGDVREIVFKKNNYGPIGARVVVRYQNGLFLPVPGMSSLDRLAHEQRVDNVFLVLLRRLRQQSRFVSDKFGSNYAPAAFAKETEAISKGITKADFATAMVRLFAASKIHNESYGRSDRTSFRLAEGAP